MKRLFAFLIPLMIFIGTCFAFSSCLDEKAFYIEISDAEGLRSMEKDGDYKLVCDIDLEGEEWTPIEEFGGTLLGEGYTISNLTITKCEEKNIGFFGKLTTAAEIDNINFADVKIDISERECNVGVIAGSAEHPIIGNVSVSGEVNAPKSACCGGIVGNGFAAMSEIINDGLKVAGKDNVGGLLGFADVEFFLSEDLENHADVSGENNVGGLYGYVKNRYSFSVVDCNNTGKITGSGNFIGGLCGYIASGDNKTQKSHSLITKYCSNTGNITGIQYVGGLYGYAFGDVASVILECTNKSTVEAETVVGCLAGWLDNISIKECENAGSALNATKYFVEDGNKYAYVGGFAGAGYAASDCTNAVAIEYTAGGMYVGGIIGCCSTKENAKIALDTLENKADICGADYVGGLYGYIKQLGDFDCEGIFVADCKNSGNVTGSGNFVAGLAGYIYTEASYSTPAITTLENFNTGDIKGKRNIGGLYGYAYSERDTAIEDCANQSNIEAEAIVGCIAGELVNVSLKNCENAGSKLNVTKYIDDYPNKYAYIGGFAGIGGTAEGCTNTVNIFYEEGGSYVGGIVGYCNIVNKGLITLKNLKNDAAVFGGDYVGGLYGYLNHTGDFECDGIEISYCENTGTVSAANNYVGGLIGYIYTSASYRDPTITTVWCSHEGFVSGNRCVGGLYGYGLCEDDSLFMDCAVSGTVSGKSLYGEQFGDYEGGNIITE